MAKTYEELLEQAAIIRDETAAGKNTATRVGGTITDAVDYVKELQDTYAGIHTEAVEAKTEAAAAKLTAAEAKTNAGSARSIAQSAVLTANAASNTANAAKTTAEGAKTAAQLATSNATEAKTIANNAANNATAAKATADAASTAAQEAKDIADSAKQTADAASSTANEAKTESAQAVSTAQAAQNKNDEQDARIEYLSQNTYYLQEGIGCAAFDYTMSLGDVPIQSEEVTRQDGDSIILDTSANRFVLERKGKFYTKFASGGANMQGSEVYASSRHTFLNRQDKSYWYRNEDGTLAQGSSTFVIANWLKTLQSESDSTQEAAETARTAAQKAKTAAQEAKSAAENEATARAEADTELQLKIGELSDLNTIEKTSIVNAINEVKQSGEGIKEYKLLHSHTFTEDATSLDYELLTADDGTPIHQYKDILIFAELSYVEGGSNMYIYINTYKWPNGKIGNITNREFTTYYIFKLKIDGPNTTLYSENHTNSFSNAQYNDGNQGRNLIRFSSNSLVFTYDRLTINFPFKANNKILIYGR